jgi:hypothetical protein
MVAGTAAAGTVTADITVTVTGAAGDFERSRYRFA